MRVVGGSAPARMVGVALTALVVLPLVFLVWRALALGAEGHAEVLWQPATGRAILQTLGLSLGVGVTCVALAVPLAWWTHCTDLPGRRFFRIALNLPLAVPTYVSGFLVIVLLGPMGWLQGLLAPLGVERLPDVYGFPGAYLALLFAYPLALLSLQAALARVDPRLWEAARSLGGGSWRAFRTVVLPELRPAMASAVLLVGLYVMGDFGAVSLMRYESLSYLIYLRYGLLFDRHEAIFLALVLIALAVMTVVALQRLGGRVRPALSGLGARRSWPVVRLGRWRWVAWASCTLVFGLMVVLPVVVVLLWLGRGIALGHAIPLPWTAAMTSIGVGVLSCAVVVGLALLPALLARFGSARTAGSVRLLAHTGYALPGIVVALAFVFLSVQYALPLYQTLTLLMLAYVVRFLPLGVDALSDALAGQSPRLYEAARGLGATHRAALRRVVLPNTLPAVWAALLAVFIAVIKELPATLLLSPIGMRTLATQIWSYTGDAYYSAAAPPILILLALAGIGLLLRPATATRP
jgi:iron(III) transport system permease protein